MKKYLSTIIITLIILSITGGYGFLYLRIFKIIDNQTLRLLLSGGTLLLLSILGTAIIKTMLNRIKEIKEEDEDDYRKY